MAVKALPRRKNRRTPKLLSHGQKLLALIEEQRDLAGRLSRLLEEIEDEEDHRAIKHAKKLDAGKPGIPWTEAKKMLGLKF